MRVGILSYPMLFQRDGGLQVQVRETIAALNRLGADSAHPLQAQLVDPNRERLDTFDLIHVFSAINGNYRVVEAASEMGVPVVLSPLLSPGWNRASGFRARVADRLAGRLTAWNVQTSYAQTKRALQLAKLVIALGEPEREAIISGFLVEPGKIRVFPNGISRHFFTSRPELFRHRTGITGPFVLMVGAISPYKNQLGLVQALADMQVPVVLIGRAARQDQVYLDTVLRSPWVRWLGALDHADPLLASAYCAASVVALPSHGEVFPLAVLESLAAGTPVVMTDENALDLPESAFALRKVPWHDAAAQRTAIHNFIHAPPARESVRALVEQYTWQRVASEIASCYFDLAASLHGDQTRGHAGAVTERSSDAAQPKAIGTPEGTLS
ncbi:glycosyltransferase family 4 protein [Massilia sp. METH4]|uniref:glycosyltransferase family 4 protein n=1 Tax=Massilia sp. METH4 TaxID=3123041 RepID=UPI0030CC4E6E